MSVVRLSNMQGPELNGNRRENSRANTGAHARTRCVRQIRPNGGDHASRARELLQQRRRYRQFHVSKVDEREEGMAWHSRLTATTLVSVCGLLLSTFYKFGIELTN
jgi:hypothetical protein